MADHPLRPATDRRLGRPLPYQPANRTWAHPTARACKQRPSFSPGTYAVLARVSPGCPPLPGRFPRITHPSATLLSPEGLFAFDLHVLSMPPAFNLSQDQTLQFKNQLLAQPVTLKLDGSPSSRLLEDAPPMVRASRTRQSTHTSYLNDLLKSCYSVPLREDRPFYRPGPRRQAVSSATLNAPAPCD